jgi:hypothetical protein
VTLPQKQGGRLASTQKTLDEVFEVSAAMTATAHRNMVIVVWRETPTITPMRRVEGYISSLARKHAKFGTIIVLEPNGFGAPEQKVREAHAELTNKYKATALGIAMILDGWGLQHSLFRFVLTSVQLMSAARVPQKIFQSVETAANWMLSMDEALQAPVLIAAIKETRALTSGSAGNT